MYTVGPENEARMIHLEVSYLAKDVIISNQNHGMNCALFSSCFFSSCYLSEVRLGDETLTHAAVFTPARRNAGRCLNIWWSVVVKLSRFKIKLFTLGSRSIAGPKGNLRAENRSLWSALLQLLLLYLLDLWIWSHLTTAGEREKKCMNRFCRHVLLILVPVFNFWTHFSLL